MRGIDPPNRAHDSLREKLQAILQVVVAAQLQHPRAREDVEVGDLIHLHMKENGAIEAINNKDTNNWYADKYVRIFPRSIVLGPHEAQTMKIQLINTPDMLPGEYRSHLYFRAVPDEVLSGRAKSKD